MTALISYLLFFVLFVVPFVYGWYHLSAYVRARGVERLRRRREPTEAVEP